MELWSCGYIFVSLLAVEALASNLTIVGSKEAPQHCFLSFTLGVL